MDPYVVGLVLVGAAMLGAAIVPIVLAGRPLSFPMVYIALGMVVFALPSDLRPPDPLSEDQLAERLSELAVIVSLMGAGLKLDRRFGWRRWATTWRLLGVTMPLTIAATALLGWRVMGLAPAGALLLGAAAAPTDPVLASDVQVGPPREGAEPEVRFALTSEAGLNDGLGFPFTNAAIAAVGAAGLGEWVGGWFLEDVLLKLTVGVVVGLVAGRALAWVVFRIPSERRLAESTEGFVALSATLLTYGVAELAHGYGFLAVFVAGVAIRAGERDHQYHEVLHASAESVERLLSAVILILIGGAVVGGALEPLGWTGVLTGLILLLVVRPLAGLVSLVGTGTTRRERLAISFFGVRGIGSIYYVAHALGEAEFPQADRLWAVVMFMVVVSVVLHGASAGRVMGRLDRPPSVAAG